MKKRQFLTSAAGILVGALGSSVNTVYAKNSRKEDAQTILTITGDIERTNRKKMDPVKDQLMYKRGIKFNNAYTFSLLDLEKLPSKTINPTMEYDNRVHELSGPLLIDVLNAVGIKKRTKNTEIVLYGIDGYSPEISLDKAQEYNFILATRIDGQLLSIGGFGPLFAIYDADRIEEFAKKPVDQRFAACPWGLYCIEVKSL
jgi:hypothetical protein